MSPLTFKYLEHEFEGLERLTKARAEERTDAAIVLVRCFTGVQTVWTAWLLEPGVSPDVLRAVFQTVGWVWPGGEVIVAREGKCQSSA